MRAERILRNLRDILSIYKDAAVCDIEVPEDECYQCGFARTRRPDKADFFSRLDRKIQMRDDIARFRICEAHVAKLHFTPAYCKLARLRDIIHLMRHFQDLGHLLGVCQALVNIADHAPKVPQPPKHRDEIPLDKGKIAQGQYTGTPEPYGEIHDQYLKRDHKRSLQTFNPRTQAPCKCPCAALALRKRAELFGLIGKRREYLYIDIIGNGIGKPAGKDRKSTR